MSTGAARPTVSARVDEVVEMAKAETGLDDFGGDSWREGLEVLVGAAETEARFNTYGEQSFYAGLVRPLVNRLHIEDWYRRHPEIDEQEVRVELLGVGFPRTGSTALSHLLSEDAGLPQPADLGGDRAVPAAGRLAGGRRGPEGQGAHDGRDGCGSTPPPACAPCCRSRPRVPWRTTT